MTDDTPLWLMDVDGVLNAFGMRGLPGPELRTFKSAPGYMITYNIEVLQRIADLHNAGRVEVRWLTTWEELADQHLAEEFGLPRGLKVEGKLPFRPALRDWWKLTAAQTLYDEGHRFVWTDDELESWTDSVTWLAEVDPARVLAYAPAEDVGITHAFLDQVEEWL